MWCVYISHLTLNWLVEQTPVEMLMNIRDVQHVRVGADVLVNAVLRLVLILHNNHIVLALLYLNIDGLWVLKMVVD